MSRARRARAALLWACICWPGILGAVPAAAAGHLADAEDAAQVRLGRVLYRDHCASCHGRNLQGQPLWQLDDAWAGRRAPAHDQTGHTWQHSDEDLFRMTRDGRFPGDPSGRVSAMPAFGGVLSDGEILAVLAFIKARWPLALRVAQAMLNPGFAGLPRDAATVDWRLPPNCDRLARRPP